MSVNIPQEQTKPYMMEEMAKSRRELEALVESLSDEQLTRPGKDGGWSVKDHLAHLAMWEEASPRCCAKSRAGRQWA
jgi:hypothetical protein